jgi:hypothetical protein
MSFLHGCLLKKVAFVFDSLALVWFVDELRGEIE